MSEIDKTLYADAEEIAAAIGKSHQTVRRMANDAKWQNVPEKIRGAEKKWFLTAKLPQEIQYAVLRKQLDDDVSRFHYQQQEQHHAEFNAANTEFSAGNKRESVSTRENHEPISATLDAMHDGGREITHPARQSNAAARRNIEMAGGNRAVTELGVSQAVSQSGRDAMSDGNGAISRKPMDGAIARRNTVSDLSHYTAEQRDTHLAILTIMRWLGAYPGSGAKALRSLNQGYKEGTLESTILSALNRCKQKASGKAKTDDILTMSTVGKWAERFKKQGNYIPRVRQKDMTLKSWHVDLEAMLSKNRQKRTYRTIHEELVKAYPDLTYTVMTRWISEKYDRMAIIKGQNSGMQLRAKQAYQPRTADGMEPWQEVHADGWNTHFTAPHPITGEFVTYELWDFHDVATRYIPPFGIGLTECFEVIAKGIENAIRDQGVMCILQTDSTKIVKNNTKFTGDPVKSISDKAGFTIVHPKTVGNAQANGISENFHTWIDKQCRVLATYQAQGQDSLTLRNVKKITADMVKAANKGELELRDKLKKQAEKIGGGIVFGSYQEALEWLESIRNKWNNKPHSALKKVADPVIGKMRHQTPQECLDEHKAAGWEPVMMDDAMLADLFRVHVELRVTRGMVKPYGGMLFRAPELDMYEGDRVVVAYDSMDYSQVWVKNLKGELICVAPFHEPTGYRAQTAYEAAQEKRAVAQIKNRERQIDQIKARAGMDEGGNIIDGEVLRRVELIETETVEPLMRLVVEDGFNEQKAEKPPMTYLETWQHLQGGNSAVNE